MKKLLTQNPILMSDGYKYSHYVQLPPNTERSYAYIESRGGIFDETVFFGLQMFIKRYMTTPITMEDIDQAEPIIKAYGMTLNREGFERIVTEYGGMWPVTIRAVPEGKRMPTSMPLVTIESELKNAWVTAFIETQILRAVWYGTTVASNSYESKKIIKGFLEETGTPEALPYMLWDFGARGVSSQESAEIGGAAHLVNFSGSDTMAGILAAMDYYDAKVLPSGGVPAMEHSTVTSWGRDGEADAYKNMLDHFAKPGAIVSIVSDSYDLFNAIKIFGTDLKDQIIASGATLVVRPDSGNPADIVLQAVQELEKYFGSTVNSKGYKVLNTVRVLQGDGITHESIRAILSNLKFNQYSADCIGTFGQGGKLLQGVDRDTMKFAQKTSAVLVNGEWREVFKDPITDSGKRSKKGRVTTALRGSKYIATTREELSRIQSDVDGYTEVLQTVYENGKLVREQSFDEIRANANA